MRHYLLAIYLFFSVPMYAQQHLRVLFLGNSYTAVNSLPQVLSAAALSAGDTLTYEENSPGGYTLQGHASNSTSLGKIAAGNWHAVVLQEQSQLPSFPIEQVQADVFPYARQLDSLIHLNSPCAKTVFYMTWGRKNGDASNCPNWPPVCTYAGMDSLLSLRYVMMATTNQSTVSPVGAVWKYLRQYHPGIELYQADESHPSAAGTYAAACAFYATLFNKNPESISYPFSLLPADAQAIRSATKKVVFDSLQKWDFTIGPKSVFSFTSVPHLFQVQFINQSLHAQSYHWDFGDGTFSDQENPSHTFPGIGLYTVQLIASHCGRYDTTNRMVRFEPGNVAQPLHHPDFSLLPNTEDGRSTLYSNAPLQQVSIYTGTGQLIRQWPQMMAGTALHFYLPDGIYLLQVQHGGQEKVLRFCVYH